MLVIKNRTVLKVARNLRGFLNLDAGVVRGAVPNLERSLQEAQAAADKHKHQLQQAQAQLSERERQLAQTRERLSERKRQLAQARERLSERKRQLQHAQKRLSNKDRQIAALQGNSEAVVATARKYAAKEYGQEQGLPVVDMLDLFPNLEETVSPYSFLEGQALPTDIVLLKNLARMSPGCRYFEIGSWRGESLANVASIAEESVSLSLSEDELVERGFSEAFVKQHKFYSAELENVRHIGHNSHTFDFSDFENRFDLVFVDGDHSREGVEIDTRNVFKLLKDDQAVIVWHDYGFTPERINWPVFAGILDGCPEDKRNALYHVSNTLCAVYLNGNKKLPDSRYARVHEVPSKSFAGFQIPNKTFEVKLTAYRTPVLPKNKEVLLNTPQAKSRNVMAQVQPESVPGGGRSNR